MSKYGKEVNQYLIQVQNGDKDQLARLFDLTANHLRVVACKYLIDKSYCDDVVSEVFCKVLQYIKSFNGEKDGYNWLCKITERVAYTYNNQDRELRQNTVALDKVVAADKKDESRDIKLDLYFAMQRLSERDREILYDYFYENKTYEEIAKKNGISTPGVFKAVHSSFKKIEKFLLDGKQKD